MTWNFHVINDVTIRTIYICKKKALAITTTCLTARYPTQMSQYQKRHRCDKAGLTVLFKIQYHRLISCSTFNLQHIWNNADNTNIYRQWHWLTACVFPIFFDGNAELERLEQYERKGRLLLHAVSGVSGLNSYKNITHIYTNLFHFCEQHDV